MTRIPIAELIPPQTIPGVGTVESFAPLPDKPGRYAAGIAVLDTGKSDRYAVGMVFLVDDSDSHELNLWRLTNTVYDLTGPEAEVEQARQLKAGS